MKKLREFWNSYSHILIRFWVNQIVMSVLGISVGLAILALNSTVVTVIGCVFCVGILCFLQYDLLFMFGESWFCKPKDIARPSRSLGLRIALLGYAPLALLCVIGFLLQLFSVGNGSVAVKLIYYALHGSYMLLHSLLTTTVLNAESLFSQCMGWVCCLLYTIPVIGFCSLGFALGEKDKPLRSFFGIKVKIKVTPDRLYRNKD